MSACLNGTNFVIQLERQQVCNLEVVELRNQLPLIPEI
jgi:hypothetical protein